MQTFPFGLPGPTVMYLVLYVLTLAAHWVFAAYVLVGAGYLAFSSAGGRNEPGDPAARVLGDWLPFFISTAITLGVAPLLFVQILYQRAFYSANLLLSHRWMAILPLLIIGFYLLYVIKRRAGRRPNGLDRIVRLIATAVFLFTAYSWTENHLLSTRESTWPEFYRKGIPFLADVETFLRLGALVLGAIPVACMVLVRQVAATAGDERAAGSTDRMSCLVRLARMALAGLAGATVMGVTYGFVIAANMDPAASRELVNRSWPYGVIVAIACLVSGWMWIQVLLSRGARGGRWTLQLVVTSLLVTGVAVMRECLRMVRVDFPALYDRHAEAAENGGMIVFLAFAVINAGLILWAVQSVRGAVTR